MADDDTIYGQPSPEGYLGWKYDLMPRNSDGYRMNIVSPSNLYTEFLDPIVSAFRDGALEDVRAYMSSQSWDPRDEIQFSCSVVSDSATPWTVARLPPCPSPAPRVHPNPCPLSGWCHPTISSCHPLLLLPSIFASIRVFSNESALHIRWPKYCS